jgi:hypothetical protein
VTYRAGVDPRLYAEMGQEIEPLAGEPRLVCDRCGFLQSIYGRCGPSALWLSKRTLRGWRTTRTEDARGVHRVDLCPTCRRSSP